MCFMVLQMQFSSTWCPDFSAKEIGATALNAVLSACGRSSEWQQAVEAARLSLAIGLSFWCYVA